LAIVHGLAYLKKINCPFPIYSDSRTAISWVKKKAIKTNLERSSATEELFKMVDSALEWLHKNPFATNILKWETEDWGENPADYGRK
jgi:ribonuclease HI